MLRYLMFNSKLSSKRFYKRMLSFILSFIIIFSILPIAVLTSADTVQYPRPRKIAAIDASDSAADNHAWYTGTETANGTTSVISRYSEYVTGQADPVTYLATVLGTENCPYIIETGLEMADLATTVNTNGIVFTDKYIRIKGSLKKNSTLTTNVIDLIGCGGLLYQSGANSVGWVPCDENNNNTIGWTPIGSSANKFNGHIYADDSVKIYNLSSYLTNNSTLSSTSVPLYFGLFGYVDTNASFSNLNLKDVQLYNSLTTSGRYISGLVGMLTSGATISDCSVAGITTGNRETTKDSTAISASLDNGSTYSESWYTVPDFTMCAQSSTSASIGGIVGTTSKSSTSGTVNTNILNVSINATFLVQSGNGIGGVVGQISNPSVGTFKINGVSGKTNIKAVASDSYMYQVGGVVGRINNTESSTQKSIVVDISGVGTSDNYYNVSIVGRGYAASGNGAEYGGFSAIVGSVQTAYSLIIGNSTKPCYATLYSALDKVGSNSNFYLGGVIGRCSAPGEATLNVSYCNIKDSVFKRYSNSNKSNRISVGGIIGALNNVIVNSSVSHCTVDNFSFSADGFIGGIVGTATSSDGCYIANITNCSVTNSKFEQSTEGKGETVFYVIGSIVSSTSKITASQYTLIDNCIAENNVFKYICNTTIASYCTIGGIAGRADGSSITNCISDVTIDFGNSDPSSQNPNSISIGGIVGAMSNCSISNCIAALDYNYVNSIENTIEDIPITINSSKVAQNIMCGGIAGYASTSATLTNSFASGDINVTVSSDNTISNRQSVIGGLIAVLNTSSTTIEKCFSTMSLGANMQDAVGGLVGYNGCNHLVMSDCHFGGSLLDPYAASIVRYSTGGTITNITYNKKMSPNAPSASSEVTATNSETIPAAIATATSSLDPDYYAAATAISVSFTGNHVFAVTNSLSSGANYETVENTGTSNDVTIKRSVKLVRNLIDDNEDGVITDYSIGSATDLAHMQEYVAIGGGFLGAKFSVSDDFTSSIALPIGMCDSTVKIASVENQPFLGVFNGNSHTITLTSDKASASYNGLFGYIQDAKITSININYNNANSIESSNYAGGLVGYAAFSEINNVNVTANDGLILGGTTTGGIVGFAKSTIINPDSTQFSSFTGKLKGNSNVGGIIGKAVNTKPTFLVNTSGGQNYSPLSSAILLSYLQSQNSTVNNCYVTGDILGGTNSTGVDKNNDATNVGGLIGYACGNCVQMTQSFMFGNVSGGKYVGGLIGYLETPSSSQLIMYSYMQGDIYANNFAGGLVGYVKNASEVAMLVKNAYFIGQINCAGSLGALTSSLGNYANFVYDKQVAGNLPICANIDEDTNVEKSGIDIIDAESISQIIQINKNYDVLSSDIVSSNPSNGKTVTVNSTLIPATIKFYGSNWTYTAGTASTLTQENNNNRLAANNNSFSNGETSNKFEVTFAGTAFSLYDYISTGHDAYTVYVDGTKIEYNPITREKYGSSSLYKCTQTFASGSSTANITYYTKNGASSTGYLAYASTDSGLTASTILNILSIENLPNTSHTITIVGYKTKSNSYMNIRGFNYAVVDSSHSGWLQDSAFTITDTNYPQLSAFVNNSATTSISEVSTDYLYNFTTDIEETSHNFKNGSTVTVNSDNYDYTTNDKSLSELGITQTDNVFTANQMTAGGNFKFTTTRSVNGYSLSIDEQIVVVPFELGSGTQESPYQIRNVYELNLFRMYINQTYGGAGQYFVLSMTTTTPAHSASGNVYDLSGQDQTSDDMSLTIDEWSDPIGNETNKFQGHLDGNNKRITNVVITSYKSDDSQSSCYSGLFGYVSDAVIEKLYVEGTANITVNEDDSSTTNKDSYFGGISAILDNSKILNCTSKFSIDVTNNTTTAYAVYTGGAVGYVTGNSTIKGVLCDTSIVYKANSNKSMNSDLMASGLIFGAGNLMYSDSKMYIDQCVGYGKITYSFTNSAVLRVMAGGIVGKMIDNNTDGQVYFRKNSTFGEIKSYKGSVGGFIGSINLSGGWTVSLSNNISTMSLTVGNSENKESSLYIGGYFGYTSATNTKIILSSNVFGGEINAIDNSTTACNIYAGGVAGYSANTISADSTNNYYDSTKNPDIYCNGTTTTANRNLFDATTNNGAKSSYDLLDSQGKYTSPTIDSEINFGSSENLVLANKIILGNIISLNIVRTDKVNLANENQKYIRATSAFLASSNTALFSISDYDSSSAYYKATTGNKRVVATTTNTNDSNAITVKIIVLTSGSDSLDGYGKSITFYPSIESTGKTDFSYLCANPSGDGIENYSRTVGFTIYNADQLMGLDCMVSKVANDDYGNKAYSTIGTDYTVNMNNDIKIADDYVAESNDETKTTTLIIGDSTHPFTGDFEGNEHVISNAQIYSSETDVGLFGYLSGATINNLGITDSSFARIGNGNIGSFAGQATGTTFNKCFSSARVEQGETAPSGLYIGGFVGNTATTTVDNCYFTGSVGVTATSNEAYPSITGTGSYYAGGLFGIVTGETTIQNSYVASYIHGSVSSDDTPSDKAHNIGQFVGKGGANTTVISCYVDYSAGAESCYTLGDKTNVVASSLHSESGYYPSKWSANAQTTNEKVSRIAVSFSTSASSLSRATTQVGSFTKNNYIQTNTVWGKTSAPLYNISTTNGDADTITRVNSSIACAVVTYTDANNITSQRVIMFNLQCWYDNYIEANGVKTYTLKSAADLVELATMVRDGDDSNVGHTHSNGHTGAGVASDRFETAIVKLGNNISANDTELSIIGATTSTAFAGTFDGNGYTVSNANFTVDNSVAGLFGYITNTATIKNLSLSGETSITIDDTVTDTTYIGGILAIYNNGNVQKCSNSATIKVTNNSNATVYVGGVVGNIGSSQTLSYCYNMGHIIAQTDGMYISGIAGKNAGSINHCYNTGIIDGYHDTSSTSYVQKTAVSGVCANNTGTVEQCYNAGILRYSAKNKLYPIASGTVTLSYADGQYLTSEYSFKTGTTYSSGTTILSTEEMSNGSSFESNWSNWTYQSGFYPQFSYITGGSIEREKSASLVSTLSGTLTPNQEETATFDKFQKVKFEYGSNDLYISRNNANLGTFTLVSGNGYEEYKVLKKGSATFYINSDSGDFTFTREMYFINEEIFNVGYMFDFSQLIADENESSLRKATDVVAAGVDTFANATTRSDYGSGSAGSPYLINTANDLLAFSTFINGSSTGGLSRYYKLVRNIDCSGISWVPIGTSTKPFEGNFYGNGYKISQINSSNRTYNGLFGYVGENAVIKMVGLENCNFTAKAGVSSGSWTGTIAGYSEGLITNCYTRSIVTVPQSTSGLMYAGGIVGELSSKGNITGCYVRPKAQNGINVAAGDNTIVSYTSSPDLVCGILVGKTNGRINGCYTTSVYYQPIGYENLSVYGIIAGHFEGGSIENTYYDSNAIYLDNVYLYVKYLENQDGALSVSGNKFAKTTTELKTTEKSATTNGVSNDSMALTLSQDIYLGTYEMAPQTFWEANPNQYTNDGYPMLSAFDIVQYQFSSFESSNLIFNLQNIDASNAQYMNALCSYEDSTYPIYADITAKTRLYLNVLSLPSIISFNASAVAYGVDQQDNEVKWTVLNGDYTNSRELYVDQYDEEGNVTSTGSGSEMVDNVGNDGSKSISMGTINCMPTNSDKLYIYLTLKHNDKTVKTWGVYHTWDSSSLQELPEEYEE